MLLRHGRQSLSLHHAAVFRPLRLTPRCPFTTINASAAGCRRRLSTKQDARPATRRQSTRATGGSSNARSLATAVDEHQSIDSSAYGRLQSSIMPPFQDASNYPLAQLRAFDVSSPLALEEELAVMQSRERMNPHGVPGNVEEMHLVFDACIRVGKIDRAQLVLKRLSSFEGYPKEELTLLHNRYLRASLDEMRLLPDREQAEQLHKWYETYIRSQRMPQTAETIACMLKASLLSERDPARLSRFVTRYMEMAPGEAGLEVLSMADILNDQDLAIITDICPTYNLAPEDAETAAAETPEQAGSASPRDADLARTLPSVLATPQKGSGLRTVKTTLSLFDEVPQNSDFSQLSPRERKEIQLRLEKDCIDAAIERWREDNESLQKMGLSTSISQASLNSRLYDWQIALESRIKQEMGLIEAAEAAKKKTPEALDRCVYGPLLRLSTPSRLAAVTILSALNAVGTGAGKGVTLTSTLSGIAKSVEDDTKTLLRSQMADKNKNRRKRVVLARVSDGAAPQEADSSLMGGDVRREAHLEDAPWPASVRMKLAAVLLTALFESAKIQVIKEHPETKALVSQLQPAFSHVQQLKKGKKVGMFLCNKNLIEHLTREPRGDFIAKHLPMVVEPAPWTAFNKGGFLGSECSLVRVKAGDKDQRLYTEAAASRGDMDQVFKGLDVLGRTAWRLNMPVFDVMLKAWNTGEAFAKFPPLRPDVQVPDEPAASDDPTERRAWIRAVKAAENEKSGQHSVRCFVNFQMEIARAYRNQTFYFPHNVDFRGRAYPIPAYLNHMGADHSRGLLRFAKGRELGEKGLEWLKIHLANVYGFDKASLKDRASFAMDNLVNIFDSANNPLTGNRWWLKAEDPWQCLAVCFELKAALESPEPTKFVSHLPIHQDGTCNGLQHYAALGGDSLGARQVNLEPGDKPADVYSAVADIVKLHMAKDAEAGDVRAKALTGKITRKVVKQTVMTNVYGVTYIGAKKQVCKQIDALYPNIGKETGMEHIQLAAYVATLIFKALSTMFNGAHNIQKWLGEVGARICKSMSAEQLDQLAENDFQTPASKPNLRSKDMTDHFRATIVWTTPLRMPVAQPYRKAGTRVISTSLQSLTLRIPDRSDPVHSRKQLQAFPPNFIHSLDATHMLLSALECGERGVTFAAVHDSFWTHAADVDVMNSVLRDAFVKIHEEDVIGRLAAEFEVRYRGSLYLANVDIRTRPGQEIMKLRADQWRGVVRSELMLEHTRQKLLRSDDPKEVEEGKKMVTPASIIESMEDPEALSYTEDLSASGLGVIDESAPMVDLEDGGIDGEVSAADADVQADAEDADKPHEAERKSSSFENHVVKARATRNAHNPNIIQCWLPLRLPPLPKKGDFVVQRLKDSKYFFS